MGKWECKLKAYEYYDEIKNEIGIEPDFRDLMNYRIKVTSLLEVKNDFDFYKSGWILINKDASKCDEVYLEFFGIDELDNYRSNEDILNEIDSIAENAQDSNFKLYNPNFEKNLNNDSLFELGLKDLEINRGKLTKKKVEMKNSNCPKCGNYFIGSKCNKCSKREETTNDFLYAFGFIMTLGLLGIGGIIRYVINPEIPTWLILTILFFGFILIRRYYRFKE